MPIKEQRRTPRKAVSISAYVASDGELRFRSPLQARVVDLNRTGAMLHVERALTPGDYCTLTLIAADGACGELDARVVWAERDASGEYNAGVAFRNLSPDEEYLIDLQLVRGAR
jgi:muconolactone delta-isomerase